MAKHSTAGTKWYWNAVFSKGQNYYFRVKIGANNG